MKKLALLLVLTLLTFTSAFVHAQAGSTQMIADWQRAKSYTKEYLDAMPGGGYSYKPTPEMRTFAAQMLHLADGDYGIVCAATGKPNPLGKVSAEKTIPQTKEATTKAVMDSYDFVINAIQSMTVAQLQQMMKFAGHELTKAALISKAFEHQTHQRGQTVVYLRLKGVTPPSEKLF